jgi:hypothetical protein
VGVVERKWQEETVDLLGVVVSLELQVRLDLAEMVGFIPLRPVEVVVVVITEAVVVVQIIAVKMPMVAVAVAEVLPFTPQREPLAQLDFKPEMVK